MKLNISPRDLDRYCIKNNVDVKYDIVTMCYVLRKNDREIRVSIARDGIVILDMDKPNKISETLKIGVYEP